jgi:hypothetical protein
LKLTKATFGEPVLYNREGQFVLGDTWSCAWSDDDNLYCVIDDTPGFDMVLRPSRDRNVAIGSFGTTACPDLTGEMVNGMEAFGRSNQLGADGACWKGNGITSVGGDLYLSVSRHWYHVKPYDHRQISRDASILRSTDKGKTWSSTPYNAEPLPNALFPGPRFAVPWFLDVGKDGELPSPAPHDIDEYVYAVSNDGYWNNGNAIHLGRVPRDAIANLKLDEWEFYCGDRGGGPIWRAGKPGLEACYPIISKPFSFGQTGMNYLPGIERYILIGWHYPKLDRDTWDHKECVWDLYESPAPWGPWHHFDSVTWNPLGLYNPVIPSKFVSADGQNMWVLACGDFNTWNLPPEEQLYTLHQVPLTLS